MIFGFPVLLQMTETKETLVPTAGVPDENKREHASGRLELLIYFERLWRVGPRSEAVTLDVGLSESIFDPRTTGLGEVVEDRVWQL